MSIESVDRDKNFIAYLKQLAEKEDRAALAALRRGLASSSEHTIGMYRYVANWVGDDERHWKEECLYLTAALFAHYPEANRLDGNFGKSLRLLDEASVSESVGRRVTALLSADRDVLRTHLRHMVQLLKAKDIGVDWLLLLRDLRQWQHPANYVRRQWAREFWYRPKGKADKREGTAFRGTEAR